MTRLFNEEPTIALNRLQPENVEETVFTPHIDLSGSAKLIAKLNIYTNPLIDGATTLLGILAAIPNLGEPLNVGLFRQHLLNSIDEFRHKGTLLDYHPSVIEKSTFCICSALDEAILYTEWGERVCWENQSLLSKVFSQRNGGEAFFVLLEKACEQPGKLVDFIELQYMLLMLGFKGRYRSSDNRTLYQIKSDTYVKIRHFRSEYHLPVLEPSMPLVGKQPRKILSMWKVLLVVVAIIIISYLSTEYWYYNARQPIFQVVEQLGITTDNMKAAPQNLIRESNDGTAKHSPSKSFSSTNNGILLSSQQWEVVVEFTDSTDSDKFIEELRKNQYKVSSRNTESGIELFIPAGNNLANIRNLQNDIKIRFGLNTSLRKVQK